MRLLDQGLNQSKVVGRVKVLRQTIARWAKDRREHGLEALRLAGRAGRKPKLTDKDRRRLERRLRERQERLGYATPCGPVPRQPICWNRNSASAITGDTFEKC